MCWSLCCFDRCECGHCTLDLVVNPQECCCCMEIVQQCRDKMYQYEDEERKCILDHMVIEKVLIPLKNNSHFKYLFVLYFLVFFVPFHM